METLLPYQPHEIEKQAQSFWEEKKAFQAREDSEKPKYYCLPMFPYPSGQLHMGHVRNYALSDVDARFQRMRGKRVLHPIGWDAFGLPAENAALQRGCQPKEWTLKNIIQMRQQLQRLGLSFDWSREINTSDPDYFRWEQAFFLALYERGMVYQKHRSVNWCAQDKTALANEQVVEGCCWRCGKPVESKPLKQWFFKLSAFAEPLLESLESLRAHWPEEVIQMQRNWIGRSEGLEVDFYLQNSNATAPLSIYTTRPETLFGVTFVAISPHHPLTEGFLQRHPESEPRLRELRQKIPQKEADLHQACLGLKTDLQVIHPLSGAPLEVWIANFVLDEVGTGAVMAVPAHDARDFRFAQRYQLPIRSVLSAPEGAQPLPFYGDPQSRLIDSGPFSGQSIQAGREAMMHSLCDQGKARKKVNYRLQDWGASRQRYWGAPIPILTDEQGNIYPESPNNLPVTLPEIEGSFSIENNPLIRNRAWKCRTLEGKACERSSETFDTFVESSWYYLRYCSPTFDQGMVDPEKAHFWLPIDHYIGGIEHATLHLIYIRFFHKLLHQLGQVPGEEPIKKLTCQGMVLAESFYRKDPEGQTVWVPLAEVRHLRNAAGEKLSTVDSEGRPVISAGLAKMSKSKGNGVDPMESIEQYGADAVRLFILFAAPPQAALEWKEEGLVGAHRFLNRVWKAGQRLQQWEATAPLHPELKKHEAELRQALAKLIDKVTDAYGTRFVVNVAIAAMMEFSNLLFPFIRDRKIGVALATQAFQTLLKLLHPVVPHLTEILWSQWNPREALHETSWPQKDALDSDEVLKKLVVQLNGKKVGFIALSPKLSQEEARSALKLSPDFKDKLPMERLEQLPCYYKPGRVLNFVLEASHLESTSQT